MTVTPARRPRVKIVNVTRTMAAAAGDVSYTGAGFRPRALLVLHRTGNLSISIGVLGGGYCDSGKNMFNFFEIAAGDFASSTSNFITYQDTAGNAIAASVKSLDSDGFTLTWTKAGNPTSAADFSAEVICIG